MNTARPIKPLEQPCARCGQMEFAHRLNADDLCEICASLERLKDTLIAQGKMRTANRPDLFDQNKRALPPTDRE